MNIEGAFGQGFILNWDFEKKMYELRFYTSKRKSLYGTDREALREQAIELLRKDSYISEEDFRPLAEKPTKPTFEEIRTLALKKGIKDAPDFLEFMDKVLNLWKFNKVPE